MISYISDALDKLLLACFILTFLLEDILELVLFVIFRLKEIHGESLVDHIFGVLYQLGVGLPLLSRFCWFAHYIVGFVTGTRMSHPVLEGFQLL
jgi:hypothetical protein